MAHELDGHGGETAFAYNKHNGAPWHRLGVAMDGFGTIDEMLKAAHADFEVWVQPVFVMDEDTGLMVEVDSSFATLRTNPFTNRIQVLGSVGGRYNPTQNRELLERALEIVGAAHGDAVIDTVGVLHEGRRFFASIDLGSLIIDPDGVADRIARNLLVYSSHDGSAQITYANTDVRAVCQNTVTMGLGMAARTFKVKHTPNSESRLNDAQKALGLSTEWSKSFAAMAEEMLSIPMTSDSLGSVIQHVWPLEKDATDRVKKNHEVREDSIRALYAGPKNLHNYGANGWAAWNSIVEYLDHHAGGDKDGAQRKRDEAAMDDNSLATRLKLKAQEGVLALV